MVGRLIPAGIIYFKMLIPDQRHAARLEPRADRPGGVCADRMAIITGELLRAAPGGEGVVPDPEQAVAADPDRSLPVFHDRQESLPACGQAMFDIEPAALPTMPAHDSPSLCAEPELAVAVLEKSAQGYLIPPGGGRPQPGEFTAGSGRNAAEQTGAIAGENFTCSGYAQSRKGGVTGEGRSTPR